jgi:hypothetical protein
VKPREFAIVKTPKNPGRSEALSKQKKQPTKP